MKDTMTQPRLVYFDFAGSRGEECRMALHLAGIAFEDVRVSGAQWKTLKPTTPFGSMPVLELPGKPPLPQSNAILVYIGRQHGLHPQDAFEAAREEMAGGALRTWGSNVERELGAGPFLDGDKLHVADIKLYMIVRWFASGSVDHVPPTVFQHCPKLMRLYEAVGEHPGVKGWIGRGR